MQVLIFGGHINNKGAQSMLFTVVDKIRKNHSSSKIYVVTENEVDNSMKNIYNFEFLEINIRTKLSISEMPFSIVSLLTKQKINKKQKINFIEKIKKADYIVDISGFALSSKFSRNNTINYLANISLAKKYKIPMYLMPQSFGPFNYKIPDKFFLINLLEKYLKYPVKIYAREQEGLQYLKKIGLSNVEYSLDTVFKKDKDFNINNVYKNNTNIRTLDIKKDAVGVIPNIKIFNKDNEEKVYDMYYEIIKRIVEKQKKVYLLRHSTEDLNIIQKIHEKFEYANEVVLIEEEYSSLELQKILSQFDFIVASRYHSIVHSFSEGTPALVFGWAVKYEELMKHFKQEAYQFNIDKLNLSEALVKVDLLCEKFEEERKVIENQLIKEKENDTLSNIFK